MQFVVNLNLVLLCCLLHSLVGENPQHSLIPNEIPKHYLTPRETIQMLNWIPQLLHQVSENCLIQLFSYCKAVQEFKILYYPQGAILCATSSTLKLDKDIPHDVTEQ